MVVQKVRNRPCLSHGTYTFSAKMAKCPKFHLNGSRGPLRGNSDKKKISTSFDPGVGGATSFMCRFGAIWSKFKFLHYFCLVQPNHTKFSPKYLYKSTMGLTKKKLFFLHAQWSSLPNVICRAAIKSHRDPEDFSNFLVLRATLRQKN